MTNTETIQDGQIKVGDFITFNVMGQPVRRKVLFIQKDFAGNEVYIAKHHRQTGIVRKNEILKF